ncbi:hypothetical protein PHYBLDRAFT_146937 [Phycomyces blakesleeanus NRRL 1555(-)]|uniref:Uncharacterized protein n=1 Tax=Phycomyces blakesleeanus (strain ATCC 8743b / DSM 1359 / FGSC 10004 / NBRC 33097 / NRRL 1555) TaxID=763407 RepID=A0A162U2Z7_PHYB8|nr:hypothetical protein PHYBLDRAFT_146937 [Phycomyces blakesleeanus NRRL 1555(-)]OAD71953.1 hypothetical protein PHYBLDRAFT_146937 [Phycomyces blakesleeanus NRRL 1555(-)]|eukprot:XP_018289993.1 hypothetical protein PHYBLDRAFT_146937 [Phycomyces blakesleeanus NRRL 1555(-)]
MGNLTGVLGARFPKKPGGTTLVPRDLSLGQLIIDINAHESGTAHHDSLLDQTTKEILHLYSGSTSRCGRADPGSIPVPGVDTILFLPASHVERGCLIRWRMGWLLGKPKECPGGSDYTSRCHLLNCPLVPATLFEQLPQPNYDQIHRIDFAITSLPLTSQELRPAY